MIKKILISNRGEIVSRIARTCKKMGIKTVGIFSVADEGAPYLKTVDETVLVGPANPVESYLNMKAIIDAALKTNADAIHPGYGFLSERGLFAKKVVDAGIGWIGPPPDVLLAISSKCYMRHLAVDVGAEVTPGTLDPVTSPEEVISFGNSNGWPLFIKLDKGGGGKGIEMVSSPDQVAEILERTSSIGNMAFGSSDCYIETAVINPRHIEVQFIADKSGNVVCLGERECSIQRRHQKIIEESLSPVIKPKEREKMFANAEAIVKKMGYIGAGTLEGLRTQNGDYYFMEVNARLQVEHPVSEFISGEDIIQRQIEIASGMDLDFTQDDVTLNGHSIEARIYAEDPDTFMPSPGTISKVVLPETGKNLRVDHNLANGCVVPPYYDPMLAKIISWDVNRPKAIARLIQGLKEFKIVGVKTTIPINLRILEHPKFLKGDMDTGFIENYLS
jgi:acetyl-CoA carboxylase biotin carboxylase subunit